MLLGNKVDMMLECVIWIEDGEWLVNVGFFFINVICIDLCDRKWEKIVL